MNSSSHSRRSYKEKCGTKGPQTERILSSGCKTQKFSLPQPDQQVLTFNPLPQPLSSRLLSFHNRYCNRKERFPHRHQTAGCGPQASRCCMPFLSNTGCLQRITRACHTQCKEYVGCSRGRIVYVIIVSLATLTKIDSLNPHTESQSHDSPIPQESPPLSPLKSLGSNRHLPA